MNALKKIKRWKRCIFSFAILIGVSTFVHAQSQPLDCKLIKDGTFKMPGDSLNPETIIVRLGNKQTESSAKIKSFESVVKWTSDCSYILTPTEKTIAAFPTIGLPKGCFLTVKIIEIKGDQITIESEWNFFKKVYTTKVLKIK